MTREKVGKVAYDLMLKNPESYSAVELQEAMQEDYLKNLVEAVETGKKQHAGSFYAIVITKNERLMPNVFRNYFTTRISCPTPEYDQSVYYYSRAEEQIRYVWTIPSKDACIHLKENALYVHPEEKQLLEFVLMFEDGSLLALSKQLNNERADSPLLQEKQ